jgi:hypothetical protein
LTIVTKVPVVTENIEVSKYLGVDSKYPFSRIVTTKVSSEVVSAYTRAVESIVKKINPAEIFTKELTFGIFINFSDEE